MTKAQLLEHVRLLFNDLPTSNLILREKLSDRPGNKFDGVNVVYFLFNRRITSIDKIYDAQNNILLPADYTLVSGTGQVTTAFPLTDPNTFADYYYQRLTDAEIDYAITTAAAPAGFNPNSDIPDGQLDFIAMYVLAFCYLSAASKASEYFTVSSAGKQVSKSELYNHFYALYEQCLTKAQALRTDKFTDRGSRETPYDATSGCNAVQPYLLDSGGG